MSVVHPTWQPTRPGQDDHRGWTFAWPGITFPVSSELRGGGGVRWGGEGRGGWGSDLRRHEQFAMQVLPPAQGGRGLRSGIRAVDARGDTPCPPTYLNATPPHPLVGWGAGGPHLEHPFPTPPSTPWGPPPPGCCPATNRPWPPLLLHLECKLIRHVPRLSCVYR